MLTNSMMNKNLDFKVVYNLKIDKEYLLKF